MCINNWIRIFHNVLYDGSLVAGIGAVAGGSIGTEYYNTAHLAMK